MLKFSQILSAINIPGCKIATVFTLILVPLTHNEFTITDPFSFAKEIITYDSSLYVASLIIKYLFIDIPLNETINNFVSDLHNKNLYNGKLSKKNHFKFLETETSASSFSSDDLLYKEAEGVAMTFVLGAILANVLLSHYIPLRKTMPG